jgi:hypothetical protein
MQFCSAKVSDLPSVTLGEDKVIENPQNPEVLDSS